MTSATHISANTSRPLRVPRTPKREPDASKRQFERSGTRRKQKGDQPSITLLSRVKDYFLEFGSAPLAAAALPHQIGLHRPENLFPRHTRSFFWCAGRQ